LTEHKPAPDAGSEFVVIRLPAEVDLGNADTIGRELADALAPGVVGVVADLTDTTFCDSAGTRMLALAYLQAIDNRIDLRLAIPGSAVRRALEIAGLNHVLPVFTSLDDALALIPAYPLGSAGLSWPHCAPARWHSAR
jgi:anti-sigma B factor antagonist